MLISKNTMRDPYCQRVHFLFSLFSIAYCPINFLQCRTLN